MTINDALSGVFRYKKEIISLEECNKLKERIDQLENTIKALEMTNAQLAELIKETKPPQQKDRVSFIG